MEVIALVGAILLSMCIAGILMGGKQDDKKQDKSQVKSNW